MTSPITGLAAEDTTLSTDRGTRTPERTAAYFPTTAAVPAEIATNRGPGDHPLTVEARRVATQARRHALDITDEPAAGTSPATHPF